MKRFLGLDYGSKTIGVAVSSPSGKTAIGLATLRRKDPEAFRPILKELKAIIKEHGVAAIVLGLPKHLSGDDSAQTKATLYFKEKLERYVKNKPVLLWDERLSTKAVEGTTSNKTKIDEMAAVYILQGFLDKKNMEGKMTDENTNQEEGIVLVNDDGEEIPLVILTSREDETGTYILAGEENEEGEAAMFKCIPEGEDEMIFELVDGEHELYEHVLKLFKDDFEEFGIDIGDE